MLIQTDATAGSAPLAAHDLAPAREPDVPEIVALMNLAYRGGGAAPDWSTEAGYITGNRTTMELLRAELAEKPHAAFLLWRDPQTHVLKGCVWLEPLGGDIWYLGSLAIDPQIQKGGLGHALLMAAEHWARIRGARRMRMSVVNIRTVLIAWYARRGYRETGETSLFPYGDDRFGTPQRDDLSFVTLEKELTQEA
jgi:GNAT superfamily N-acetyltransferase